MSEMLITSFFMVLSSRLSPSLALHVIC